MQPHQLLPSLLEWAYRRYLLQSVSCGCHQTFSIMQNGLLSLVIGLCRDIVSSSRAPYGLWSVCQIPLSMTGCNNIRPYGIICLTLAKQSFAPAAKADLDWYQLCAGCRVRDEDILCNTPSWVSHGHGRHRLLLYSGRRGITTLWCPPPGRAAAQEHTDDSPRHGPGRPAGHELVQGTLQTAQCMATFRSSQESPSNNSPCMGERLNVLLGMSL